MDQRFSIGIQHEDVRLSLAPAAPGNTEIGERCFAFGAEQIRSVLYELNQVASLLVLIIGGSKLRLETGGTGEVDCKNQGENQRKRVTRVMSCVHENVYSQAGNPTLRLLVFTVQKLAYAYDAPSIVRLRD